MTFSHVGDLQHAGEICRDVIPGNLNGRNKVG